MNTSVLLIVTLFCVFSVDGDCSGKDLEARIAFKIGIHYKLPIDSYSSCQLSNSRTGVSHTCQQSDDSSIDDCNVECSLYLTQFDKATISKEFTTDIWNLVGTRDSEAIQTAFEVYNAAHHSKNYGSPRVQYKLDKLPYANYTTCRLQNVEETTIYCKSHARATGYEVDCNKACESFIESVGDVRKITGIWTLVGRLYTGVEMHTGFEVTVDEASEELTTEDGLDTDIDAVNPEDCTDFNIEYYSEDTDNTEMNTEPTDITEMNTEPTDITDMKTEPTDITEMNTEHTDIIEMNTEPTDITEMNTEPTDITEMNTEPTDITEMNTDHTDISEINTEHTDTTEMNTENTRSTIELNSKHTATAKITTERTKATKLNAEYTKPTEASPKCKKPKMNTEHTRSTTEMNTNHTETAKITPEHTKTNKINPEYTKPTETSPKYKKPIIRDTKDPKPIKPSTNSTGTSQANPEVSDTTNTSNGNSIRIWLPIVVIVVLALVVGAACAPAKNRRWVTERCQSLC